MLYCAVLYSDVLYCTVLYCAVLYCVVQAGGLEFSVALYIVTSVLGKHKDDITFHKISNIDGSKYPILIINVCRSGFKICMS